MRVFAWIMVVITVLTVGLAVYELATLKLGTESVQIAVTPASKNQSLFDEMRAGMDNDSLTGRIFLREAIGNAEDYVFVTYTVPVKNMNFLSAEWIELVVTAQEGDVAQVSTGDAQKLPGLSRANLSATVLCRLNEQEAAARKPMLEINYFLFGRPYSFEL